MPHPREVAIGFAGPLPGIEMGREIDKAATHDLGKKVVAAREVPVRCLMRYLQLASDVPHAEPFDTLLGDDLAGCLDTGLLEVEGFVPGSGHGRAVLLTVSTLYPILVDSVNK